MPNSAAYAPDHVAAASRAGEGAARGAGVAPRDCGLRSSLLSGSVGGSGRRSTGVASSRHVTVNTFAYTLQARESGSLSFTNRFLKVSKSLALLMYIRGHTHVTS